MPRKKTYVECSVCGAPVDAHRKHHCTSRGIPVLCVACGIKRAEENRKRKAEEKAKTMNEKLDLHCAVCGKPIPWIPSYSCAARIPKTCSRSCGTKLAMRDRTYTRESLLEKLTAYIKSVGHPMTYKEIIEGCGVKTTILQKFNISLVMLQKEIFGMAYDRSHLVGVKVSVESVDALNKEFGLLHDKDFDNLRNLVKMKKDYAATRYIKAIIGKMGRYVGIVEFMDKTNLAFESLCKYDIESINKSLGMKWDRRSAAENDLYEFLVKVFGKDGVSREHTFMDCRGKKGWPLRFDYFLPEEKILIELDGSSHNVDNNLHKDLTDENREIKREYAERNGMRLLVYKYESVLEVKKIFCQIVLDVIKPVELLETPSGQSATKPTLSEGSETIERRQGRTE